MFSSSVAGGSICLGCQLRAVTRRVAAPISSKAAQTRIRNRRRRYYASKAARAPEDDPFATLRQSQHKKPKNPLKRTRIDDWEPSEHKATQNVEDRLERDGNGGMVGSNESTHGTYDQSEPIRLDDFIQQAIESQGDSKDRSDSFYGQPEPAPQRDSPTRQAKEDEQKFVRRMAIGVDWSEKARPRTYWKGDTRLVQDVRELTVDTLGRKADIIVLKDGGKYKRKKPPPVDNSSRSEEAGFEEFVDQEPGLSMDTVMQNLEEFRPEHRILPAREFKVLFDMLMNAFTSPQIAEYVTRYHERVEQGDESPFAGTLPSTGSERPWIVSEMRWIPEVRGAVPNVDSSLQGYILKSMPPKQRRVMQLMRQCWGMSVQELTHGLGALEVQVRDLEFKLLTLGEQRWLQQTTRIYLGQGKGKSISVVKSRNMLRIEAPKAIAETCLEALDKTLQKVRSRTFSMDKATFANLDIGVVEELGQLTNSILTLDKERNEIKVTWIDYYDRSTSKLEDLGDIVFRLLLTGNPPSNVEHSLKIYPQAMNQARLIEDLSPKDRLPWMHRRMRWARVCLPASTPSTVLDEAWSSSADGVLEYDVVPVPQDFVIPESKITKTRVENIVASRTGAAVSPLALPRQRLAEKLKQEEELPEGETSQISEELEVSENSQPTVQPDVTEQDRLENEELLFESLDNEQAPSSADFNEPPQWSPFRVRTSAVFGHVLHLFQPDWTHATNKAVTNTKALTNSPRTIYPLIPPVAKMDLKGWIPYAIPSNMDSMVVMRFVPSNDMDATSAQQNQTNPAPLLELRMKASTEDIIEIDSLRAVARTQVSDILFPTEAVDVRTTQRLEAELKGAMVDSVEGMGPLVTFLMNSYLAINEGKLLTPPRITELGLPQWMFRDHHDEFVAHKKSLSGSAGKFKNKKSQKQEEEHNDEGQGEEEAPLRLTSYVFAGLEVHRTLETVYDGWKLAYTSIEAGQGGGRRAELSLEAKPGYDKDLRRTAEEINSDDFLQSVYTLVRGLPGRLVKTRKPGNQKMRTTIEWLGAGKKGL